MKTLLFSTSYIPDEGTWHQRYERWLERHRHDRLGANAIVLIDDHSAFRPPGLALLPANRIGLDALPPEAMLGFGAHLGRSQPQDFPGWWRSMFASVSLAVHYGFDRIIYIESDARVLSGNLAEYLATRTSGWTALWCPELDRAESAIQVLCRDSFHLVEQLASRGPFGYRHQSIELTLPFTTIDKSFIGGRYHQFNQSIPTNADYAAQCNAGAVSLRTTESLGKATATPIEPLARAGVSAAPVASNYEHQLRALLVTDRYDAEVLCRYGVEAYENGNFVAAREALERADWLRPEDGLTCKFLGAARMQQGELRGAVAAATQSAQLNTKDADAQNMAGAFNLQSGQARDSIDYFRVALALEPEAPSALSNLALINWADPIIARQYPMGFRGIELELREALLERLRANRLTTAGAAALLAFGVHFRDGFDSLLQLAHVLIADPETDAQTLFTSGNALIVSGDHYGALAAYRRAALLAPESDRIQSAIGYASICQGGALFVEGFRIANDSWPNINPAAFVASPKRWKGATQPARLLVYQEQGIGDALICLRLLPLLLARSIKAMLWLRPELAALISDQAGLPLLNSSERPAAEHFGFDSVSPLFGLIDALGITPDQIPLPLTIKAPAGLVERFAHRLAPLKKLRVGLCLFGNPNRSDDWARSAGEKDIEALARLQDVDWINLSVDARPERESLQRILPGLTDPASDMTDFEVSAALISNLDVVVSIDSVVAHLAAALGKPVLLLCPSIADWRWNIGGKSSPWWPSVEVFAADKAGDFTSAIALVAERIVLLARLSRTS